MPSTRRLNSSGFTPRSNVDYTGNPFENVGQLFDLSLPGMFELCKMFPCL